MTDCTRELARMFTHHRPIHPLLDASEILNVRQTTVRAVRANASQRAPRKWSMISGVGQCLASLLL